MQTTEATGYVLNRTRGAQVVTRLEVADTFWSRFRGLMGRNVSSFRSGDGLWIIPCSGVHTCFMNFPIDVLYLDGNRRVVHIEERLKPWRVGRMNLRTHSVLELPANTARETGTTIGDQIEIVADEAEARPA
jgi:uncharacterized protein